MCFGIYVQRWDETPFANISDSQGICEKHTFLILSHFRNKHKILENKNKYFHCNSSLKLLSFSSSLNSVNTAHAGRSLTIRAFFQWIYFKINFLLKVICTITYSKIDIFNIPGQYQNFYRKRLNSAANAVSFWTIWKKAVSQ